jgi:hypothetical protein
MGWQERRREIKEELIGQTGKQALLVEGADDEFFFRIFLDRKFEKIWENTWVLAGAGNKKTVTEMLVQEPDWLGIVDRDEWREEVIDEKQAELNNLFVLPRFCIESYAIEPIELWQALPEKKRQKIAGGFEALESEILENKGIKNILQEWHSYLDPDAILKEFDEKLQNVQQLSQQEQFAKWLHGKQFFYEKIHPVLNKYLGQNDAKNRLKEIFRTRELPEDLKPLWARIHQ